MAGREMGSGPPFRITIQLGLAPSLLLAILERQGGNISVVFSPTMAKGLRRHHEARSLHLITFSCYHREPRLGTAKSRALFKAELERARKWYGLYVTGYVAMPEHVHLLVSEPERSGLAVAQGCVALESARY